MRITFLAPFYAPKIGGVETHVQHVTRALVSRGHHVTVLTRSHTPGLSAREEMQGVHVVRFPLSHGSEKITVWKGVAQNLSLLWRSDVIHVHDVMWWLAPWLPVLFWKPIHLTHHGWEGTYPVPVKNKLQRWVWAHCARTLTHVGAWIQQFYWESPDFVTYGGVEDSVRTQVNDRPPRQPLKTLEVVFLGRLERENDVEGYISLVMALRQKWKNVRVTWVGDGALRGKCQAVGEVTGLVPDPSRFLAQADLVFSSSYLSMLQAQALGKVVCALYSHPLKQRYLETYPGKKWLILGSEPARLAAALEELFSDPDRVSQLRVGAHKWAAQQTWLRVARTYEKLWSGKNSKKYSLKSS